MQYNAAMTEPKGIEKTAIALTHAIGSPTSLVVHTIAFGLSFFAVLVGIVEFNQMLLVLTTIVSLEAIYLSLFIQMTVNIQARSIEEVSEDIEEIQEDVGEIQEDVEEISEDVDEIQKDVDELQEDVEDISEDVEELNEEDAQEEKQEAEEKKTLAAIQADLRKLMDDIDRLKK